MSNLKKISVVVLVVLIVLAGLFYIILSRTGQNQRPLEKTAGENKPELKKSEPVITRAAEKTLPDGFLKEIPLGEEIKITESYSAVYPNSTAKQATISFASEKTLKENYEFYKKWAEENKWQIANQENSAALKFLYLKKDGQDINITITEGLDKSKAKVSISYTKL